MASYNVKALKFRAPQPEILPGSGAASIVDEHTPGWSAVANEDCRMVVIKVKALERKTGKVVTKSFRVPFEDLRWIQYLATSSAKPGDEPADPK